ncbi:hypothetical protein GBA52_020509 [Prunus armeniaca]|nr:hypothetical protein GBA52_020509 [Prunus armeniaca]
MWPHSTPSIFKEVRNLIIDMETRAKMITSGSQSINSYILFTVDLNCTTPGFMDLHFTAGNDAVERVSWNSRRRR